MLAQILTWLDSSYLLGLGSTVTFWKRLPWATTSNLAPSITLDHIAVTHTLLHLLGSKNYIKMFIICPFLT